MLLPHERLNSLMSYFTSVTWDMFWKLLIKDFCIKCLKTTRLLLDMCTELCTLSQMFPSVIWEYLLEQSVSKGCRNIRPHLYYFMAGLLQFSLIYRRPSWSKMLLLPCSGASRMQRGCSPHFAWAASLITRLWLVWRHWAERSDWHCAPAPVIFILPITDWHFFLSCWPL